MLGLLNEKKKALLKDSSRRFRGFYASTKQKILSGSQIKPSFLTGYAVG